MNETFMKEKPVFSLLVSMAFPMVISMLVNSLYNIVDRYFVAKISEDAMTALSLVFPVQNFINAAGIGFGVGMNAVISFYLGAKDYEKADMATTQGLLLSAVHGVLLTIVSIEIMPFFLLFIYRIRSGCSFRNTVFRYCIFFCFGCLAQHGI